MNNRIKNHGNLEINKITIFFIILTSIFLNHSNRDYGINISLSDFFIIISVLLLLTKEKFIIPMNEMIFFILLSISLISVSLLYVPRKFGIYINHANIMKDYIKLLVSFLFLLFGYNISRIKMMETSIKWYSLGAFTISILGLLLNILNINILKNLMYFGASRFRGLMIDPNYYSVIQCTALVYFLRNKNISKISKISLYILNFIFIAMSGSKTGMITLLIYSILMLLEFFLPKKNISIKSILGVVIITIMIISFYSTILEIINLSLDKMTEIFPIFNRVRLLFTDFSVALKEGGSGRDSTIDSAIGIIKSSPILGVGVGNYLKINKTIYGRGSVAHNTFLQIYAEWGGLLATIFFGYIFNEILKVTWKIKNNLYDTNGIILRDIIIILLIGSLGISLNNARMFWMFLGGLIFVSNKQLVNFKTEELPNGEK